MNSGTEFDALQALAEAVGKTVYFGVRAGGQWFVHCDGIEFDTAPEDAAETMATALRKREENAFFDAKAAVRKAHAALEAIDAIASTDPRSETGT